MPLTCPRGFLEIGIGEMDTLIQDMLRGSQELDRMKREIYQTIKMIKGLLDKEERPFAINWLALEDLQAPGTTRKNNGSARHSFSTKSADWMLLPGGPGLGEIVCRLNGHTLWLERGHGISNDFIYPLHSSLGDFVLEIRKLFPVLDEKLKPFLEVARL